MTRQELLDRIENRILIADGATGTTLHRRGVTWDHAFENLNRTDPDIVRDVHVEYVDAGCELIETNTFQANRLSLGLRNLEAYTREINTAGVQLARQAASRGKGNVLVAGSIGPFPLKMLEEDVTPDDASAAFLEQATLLADAGADLLLLETFTDLDLLLRALMAARKAADLPIIAQVSPAERGSEERAVEILRALEAHGADVVGGNCGGGPSSLIPFIREMGKHSRIPISAMPNASYPQFVDGRYIYVSTPEYIAEREAELVEAGANIIGGCCGTTPEHMALVVERFRETAPAPRTIVARPEPSQEIYERVEEPPAADLLDAIGDHTVILAELDPPKGMDYARIIEGSRALKLAGVDAITCAENSLATIRMSSFVMGHLIQSEVGIPAIVHCTCRDRNLIGQQSELMGASVLGLRYVLALTGDPATLANIGASSVYDTNSIGLLKLISTLNTRKNLAGGDIQRRTDFVAGCALDPSGARLDGQIKRLTRKIEAGARYALTQPLYDPERIRELYERTENLGIPIFLGVMPLTSKRNAEFLHHEVPGIRITDEVMERMRDVEPEKAKEEGISIAGELIEVALETGAPGIYLIPPFSKYEYALKLIPIIKEWDRVHRR
jgi:methionine synthase / methylenetetrahydrofolate reductase(NADPH)